MSHLTLKNDRKRRRQARTITFMVVAATLLGTAYGIGAADQLLAVFYELIGNTASSQPVASI